MSRDPVSVELEARYWQAVADDIRELHVAIVEAAGPLAASAIHVVTVALVAVGTPAEASLEAIASTLGESLKRLRGMQTRLEAMAGLLDGRLVVLREEGGLAPSDAEDDSP